MLTKRAFVLNQRLTATLGSTCRTFKAWTSRNETWALIAGHGQLPQLNDIMYVYSLEVLGNAPISLRDLY